MKRNGRAVVSCAKTVVPVKAAVPLILWRAVPGLHGWVCCRSPCTLLSGSRLLGRTLAAACTILHGASQLYGRQRVIPSRTMWFEEHKLLRKQECKHRSDELRSDCFMGVPNMSLMSMAVAA